MTLLRLSLLALTLPCLLAFQTPGAFTFNPTLKVETWHLVSFLSGFVVEFVFGFRGARVRKRACKAAGCSQPDPSCCSMRLLLAGDPLRSACLAH